MPDKAKAQSVNVVEFPADKMDAVIEALGPILGIKGAKAQAVGESVARFADIPGAGTGCERTSATGSSDWSCGDKVAITLER